MPVRKAAPEATRRPLVNWALGLSVLRGGVSAGLDCVWSIEWDRGVCPV